MNSAGKTRMGRGKIMPQGKRARKRIQNPPYRQASGDAPAAPLAITRLRNAGLQSPHTQSPAIWTKSECANARPHWAHVKTVWTVASGLIGYPPSRAKSH